MPDRAERCLDAGERARADRFAFPADRNRFVLGRMVAKHVLAAMLGRAAEEIRLEIEPGGRPVLPGSSLHFSLSHSRDLVGLAVSQGLVGLDLEWGGRPVDPAALGAFLAPDERTWLSGLAATERPHGLLDLWTAKEALAKQGGRGLDDSVRSLSVLPGHRPPGNGADPRIVSLPAPTGWHAAIALPADCREIRPGRFDIAGADLQLDAAVAVEGLRSWHAVRLDKPS